ncbi:MAG: hypothetical protein JNK48_20330 [Bryobacterales bacterium]|nr:hypothetical protein [Bryobacterales bacterium]
MRRRAFLSLGAAAAATGQPTFERVLRLESGLSVVSVAPGEGETPVLLASGPSSSYIIHHFNGDWRREPLPEAASSVSSSQGAFWIAARSGIFTRAAGGAKWQKRWEGEGLEHIVFIGPKGYAAGAGKTILEYGEDGEWRRIPAADEPTTNTANTAYHWISFLTPRVGVISGASRPPRKGRTESYPAWLDPDRASRRKEWPGASVTLETRDAGLTWRHSVTSIFGKITRVRYARDGRGLALVEFHDEFEYPSEVFAIDLKSGSSERVFRRKDRAVTDTWLFSGLGCLATVHPTAAPDRPGAVSVYISNELRDWTEYVLQGVTGNRVWLAATPQGVLWLATDSGFLCRSSEPLAGTKGLR